MANVLPAAGVVGSAAAKPPPPKRPPPHVAKLLRPPPPAKPLRPPPPAKPLRPPPPRVAGKATTPPARRPPPPAAKLRRPPPPSKPLRGPPSKMVGQAVLPSGSAPAGTMQPVLERHNFYRRRHRVPELTWSWSLATGAAVYASSCTWGHPSGWAQGESMYAASQGPLNLAEPADVWYSEVGRAGRAPLLGGREGGREGGGGAGAAAAGGACFPRTVGLARRCRAALKQPA